MKDIINNLDKYVVYIKDKELYAINKNHTLIMRFTLNKSYPEMCFSTNKWVKDSVFEAVRDKYILFRNGKELIRLPTVKVDLKKEYDSLAKTCKDKVFTLSDPIYKLLQKYGDSASFFRLSSEGKGVKAILYDTSKDQTIESSFHSLLNTNLKKGDWFLPTDEIRTLNNFGFKTTEVKESSNKNYYLLEDTNSAIVSSMRIEK